jgi:hypothetical protein
MRLHIFGLLYGDRHDLHARFLNGLKRGLQGRRDVALSLWGNQVCLPTSTALSNLNVSDDYRLQLSDENVGKYKVMRRLFEEDLGDAEAICWFDDDSHITAADWLPRTLQVIEQLPDCPYFGQIWFVHWLAGQWDWVQTAPWYRGKPPEMIKGRPGIRFCTGAYWWLRRSMLKQLDWPDVRLNHNGGDAALGEAVRQLGFSPKQLDYGVRVNDATRRGYGEAPAGCSDPGFRR